MALFKFIKNKFPNFFFFTNCFTNCLLFCFLASEASPLGECRRGRRYFGILPDACGLQPCIRTHFLKNPCAVLVWWWDGEQIKLHSCLWLSNHGRSKAQLARFYATTAKVYHGFNFLGHVIYEPWTSTAKYCQTFDSPKYNIWNWSKNFSLMHLISPPLFPIWLNSNVPDVIGFIIRSMKVFEAKTSFFFF